MGIDTKIFITPVAGVLLFLAGIYSNNFFVFIPLAVISFALMFLSYPYYKKFTPESCFAALTIFLQVSAVALYMVGYGFKTHMTEQKELTELISSFTNLFLILLVWTGYRLCLRQCHHWIFRKEQNPPPRQPPSSLIPIIASLVMFVDLCKVSDAMLSQKQSGSTLLLIMTVVLPVAGAGFFYLLLCRITGLDKKKIRPKSPEQLG